MLKNYLKIAFRNIFRSGSYTLINIVGFSISLVPIILFTLYTEYEFSYDKHNENFDRIYRVVDQKGPIMPVPLAYALQEELPEVECAVRIRSFKSKLRCNDDVFFENNVLFVDKDIFKVFTFDFIYGDHSKVLNDNYSIVISESKALNYFGNNSPIGKTINYNDIYDLVVTGVYKDLPNNSHFNADFIVSSYFIDRSGGISLESSVSSWGMGMFYTYILLKENVDIQKVAGSIKGIIARHSGRSDLYSQKQYSLQHISEIHLHSDFYSELKKNGSINQVFLYISLAVIILLIAIINYVNLATARYSQRIKELGIRKIIGAKRKQLVFQILIETLVISLTAFSITIIVATLLLPSFNQFVNRQIPINFLSDPSIFILLTAIVIITTVLSGVYPAMIISSIRPDILTGGKLFLKRSKLKKTLVVVQFSISFSLIFLATVVIKQNDYILTKDLGFDKDHILTVTLGSGKILNELDAVKSELLSYSNVLNVSSSTNLPNRTYCGGSLKQKGSGNVKIDVNYNTVDYNFLELYGIDLLEGRNFSKDFPSDKYNAAIVSKSAVEKFGWKNPIGKYLEYVSPSGRNQRKVIGVTEDFHMLPLTEKITPFYFVIDKEFKQYCLSIKIKSENVNETTNKIKQICSSFFKGENLKYSYLNQRVRNQYSQEFKDQKIFNIFSFFSLLVACFGLFGLISFSTQNMQKEIGIRKILGASSFKISQKLLVEFLILIIIGVLIAVPISFMAIDEWLSDFVYQVKLSVVMFIIPTISIMIVAILTMLVQVYKASTANPVNSLRNE